jgi:hypothetical protein
METNKKTPIECLKHYHEHRKVQPSKAMAKYIWYNHLIFLMEQAREEIIWDHTILTRNRDGDPALFGICVHNGQDDDGKPFCPLVHKWSFPIQARSFCIQCGQEMILKAFNRDRLTQAQIQLHAGVINFSNQFEVWDFLEGMAYENQREYIEKWHKTLALSEPTAHMTMIAAKTNRPHFFPDFRTKSRKQSIKYHTVDIDRASIEPFDNGTLNQPISYEDMYPNGVPFNHRYAEDGIHNWSEIEYEPTSTTHPTIFSKKNCFMTGDEKS